MFDPLDKMPESEIITIEKQILRDIAATLKYNASHIASMPGISLLIPAKRGLEAIAKEIKILEELAK